MKKFIVVVLVFVIAIAFSTTVRKVGASNPVYNTDLMLLSITDVETANQIANGDDELFAETLAQIGYDNYDSENSLEVDEGYTIFGRTLTADGISGIVPKSADNLANMTQDLLENGELKYILRDYQYISAYIYYDDRVEFEYSTMDLHAYTDSDYTIHMPEYEIINFRSKPGPIIFPLAIILDEKEVLMDVE